MRLRWLLVYVWISWAHPAAAQFCTTTTTDAQYATVNAAVASAAAEDVVCVPAGTATWANTITITQGITLKGAGSGATVITAATTPLIRYAPSAATGALDYAFRITGFTFTLGTNGGVGLCGSTAGSGNCQASNSMGAVAQTKIRIDHNIFTGTSGVAIEVKGAFRGVVDHNTFSGFVTPQRAWGTGVGHDDWHAFGALTFGTAGNLYYEDNTFTNVGGYMITDCDQGGRYVYRYNTISLGGSVQPAFDYHGGYAATGAYSCFSGEVYGNRFTLNGYAAYLLSLRGGRALAFFNEIDSSASQPIKVYTDHCPPVDHYADQLIQDSYFWNNRRTPTGALLDAAISSDVCGYLTENEEFWHDASPFTGATGVGAGTLAARPTTCTVGVGYWATTQDVLTLNRNQTGADPAVAIAGTLSRCVTTDVWEDYYTPYTYPHPQQEVDTPTSPVTVAVVMGDTAPLIQWRHDGMNVTSYALSVDGAAAVSLGLPTPTGDQYRATLPTLSAGAHTVVVQACDGATCTSAAAIYVVKL